MNSKDTENLLTQKEAARLLRLSVKTLQVWRRAGKIPYVRLGYRAVRYRREDIEKLMEHTDAAD